MDDIFDCHWESANRKFDDWMIQNISDSPPMEQNEGCTGQTP
jgi:hypothetical protein